MGTFSTLWKRLVASTSLTGADLTAGDALWNGTTFTVRAQNPTTGAPENVTLQTGTETPPSRLIDTSLKSSAPVSAYRFISASGAHVAGVGQPAVGVSASAQASVGASIELITAGRAKVDSGGTAITVGTRVKSNASGQAVPASVLEVQASPALQGSTVLGVAVTADPSGSGQVEIILWSGGSYPQTIT